MIQGAVPIRLALPPAGRRVALAPARAAALVPVVPPLAPVYRPADCAKGLLVDRWA